MAHLTQKGLDSGAAHQLRYFNHGVLDVDLLWQSSAFMVLVRRKFCSEAQAKAGVPANRPANMNLIVVQHTNLDTLTMAFLM